MRTRILLVLLALLNADLAWSQGPAPAPVPHDPRRPLAIPSPLEQNGKDAGNGVSITHGGHSGLSDWITYRRPCCSQHGWDPALQTEIYLRTGAAFPFGGDLFGDILDTGWMIQGGGKALFFDDSYLRAWFVDISLSNVYASTNNQANTNPVVVNGQVTNVSEYNRTFVGLGLGREYYLVGDGKHCGPNWRFGVDGGGRYGSASATFTRLKHTSDVIGGVYVGLQTDMEMPMTTFGPCTSCVEESACTFVLGLRTEWAYTWSDILDQSSDVQDINLLLHFGVRY